MVPVMVLAMVPVMVLAMVMEMVMVLAMVLVLERCISRETFPLRWCR